MDNTLKGATMRILLFFVFLGATVFGALKATDLQELLRFKNSPELLKIVGSYVPQNPVILEAGAFDGQDSVSFLKYWPNATVHSFEPFPEAYALVESNTKPYSNIHAYQLALGDKIGVATFYISERPNGLLGQSSSLLPPKEHLDYAPQVLFNKTVQVESTTIDAWADKHHVDHIDFMWLDMQGYELQTLKAAPRIMSTVKIIVTEVEFVEAYAGQYLYQDVKLWLEEQGFVMIGTNFDPQKFTDNGNKPAWFGDALFVRKTLLK